ncbi:MAG: NAD(P)/FAD-dependent oxidoreductase [Candidatus Micrarchaeota archaeon]
MPEKCDVLVIGAGLSGLVSSLKLRQEGLNVVLIEKNKKVGIHNQTKIDITESTGVESILEELKLPVLDHSNFSKWFSPHNDFLFESKVHDLFLKRGSEKDSIDSVAGKIAEKKGANVLFESEVKNLDFVNGSVKSVAVKQKNKSLEFFPKFVIGADGSYGTTAALAGLDSFTGKETEIAGFGFAGTDFDLSPSMAHVFFDHRFLPGGYFYLAESQSGLGFAMAVFNKNRVSKPMADYFNGFVKSNPIVANMLKGSKRLNFAAGACKTAQLKRHVRGNLCLVGDAGRVMDPLFGYGARQAIFSGYHAADTIAKNFRHHHFLLPNYQHLLGSSLLSNEREAHFLRGLFDRLTNEDFDFLVESASFLHQRRSLDEILNNPPQHLSLLLQSILRKPHRSVPLGVKLLVHRLFYF